MVVTEMLDKVNPTQQVMIGGTGVTAGNLWLGWLDVYGPFITFVIGIITGSIVMISFVLDNGRKNRTEARDIELHKKTMGLSDEIDN